MRTFLLSLLAAALCLHMGHALKCYACMPQQSHNNCLQETLCSSNDTHCVTLVVPPTTSNDNPGHNEVPMIVKTCNSTCSSGVHEFNGIKYYASCCQTDLCNYSGGISEATTRGTSGTTSGQTNGTTSGQTNKTMSAQTSGMSGQTNGAMSVQINNQVLVISVGLIGTLLRVGL
ncbi:secreted Ly-6/uPAR-related protein 1 [Microcaecilia unicolor]|uniref:Secreted Ly-6/uPAR-related protein 1-like n=1 Tax=Microcaecilia unicolor TaxID=1415580 RepID=A0A6P7Z8D7_9AMPH|nr:secreted Ly-6/uPAR-related protein 1-like [Microcaecilia unicolor]